MAITRFDLKSTLQAALNTGINLFLGAGFSVYARDKKNHNLPIGPELLTELVDHFGCAELNTLPLDRLCEVLKARDVEKFNQYLTRRFSVGEYDKRYDAITR